MGQKSTSTKRINELGRRRSGAVEMALGGGQIKTQLRRKELETVGAGYLPE